MPLTLGDARIALRDRLDESAGRRWTDAELNRYLAEGATDISRRAETNIRKFTITGTLNISEYPVPSLPYDILRLHRAEWQPTADTKIRSLEYRDLQNMDAVWFDEQASATRRQPEFWTLLGYPPELVVKVWPVPSDGGNLIIHAYCTPMPPASDPTPIDLPAGWANLTVDYAEMRALRKDADPRWKDALGNYESSIVTMIDNTRRYTDQNTVISPEVPHLPTWIYADTWGY
jgi:hypothetical protein